VAVGLVADVDEAEATVAEARLERDAEGAAPQIGGAVRVAEPGDADVALAGVLLQGAQRGEEAVELVAGDALGRRRGQGCDGLGGQCGGDLGGDGRGGVLDGGDGDDR
jgi:hypothetical protein